MSLLELTESSLHKIDLPAIDWIGLREVSEITTERMVRDQRPEDNHRQTTHGVMIEVLNNGHFGYASTPDLSEEGLQAAAKKAYEQARVSAPYKTHSFTSAVRPSVKQNYKSIVKIPFDQLSAEQLNSELISITKKLKVSDKISRTVAFLRTVETETQLLSSSGAEAHQEISLLTVDFQATAQKGSEFQTRSDGGMRGRSRQGGWEFFHQSDLEERIDKVSRQALELVEAEQCPGFRGDLVVMPDQMMLQIHESIGHPLEVDRILGDERNYAGWSFVNLEDFGNLQYGSPLMNVTFDPTITNEFASYAFDDIGNPSEKVYLIKDGKLLRGLGSLESQARSKLRGTANQRASSWNRPPIDRMANINLEAGDTSFDQIIRSIEYGVLMESNKSWSIDDFRNKFQFGCEYARLIENGKLTKTFRNPNYRGVTVPFWTSLKQVGDATTQDYFGTPYCGKGEPNQIIRVGHGSPVCHFSNIEIFGGEGA